MDRTRSDVRPARGRRPHPARGHAGAGERGAGVRPRVAEQGRVPTHDACDADLRVAARHAALHAGAMDGDRCARRSRRRGADRDGRPPDARGRAHVRRHREPRRRRVEHRRARADQARLCVAVAAEADRPLRRERLHALRAGQVVSGRAVAALGAVRVVAARRRGLRRGRGDLRRRSRRRGSRRSHRPGIAGTARERLDDRRCGAARHGHRAVVRPAGRAADPSVRGRLPGHVADRSPAGECRGRGPDGVEGGHTRREEERGLEGAGRLRAAARARRGPDLSDRRRDQRMDHERLADPRPPVEADAGRVGDGLPTAAGHAAVGRPEGVSVPDPRRSVGPSRSVAVARRTARAHPEGRAERCRRGRVDGTEGAGRQRARRGRQVRVVGRADRVVRRVARRSSAGLHAAGRRRRALSRADRRHRTERSDARPVDRARRLSAAARCAHEDAAGHARPRRHRSQHPSRVELEGTGRSHRVPLPDRPRDAAVDREVHGRRQAHGHGRRQPLRDGWCDAGRQSVPPQPAAADQPRRLLAKPSVAVVPVLGDVHRADEPGTARRRGARRSTLRARDRVRRSRAPGRRTRVVA